MMTMQNNDHWSDMPTEPEQSLTTTNRGSKEVEQARKSSEDAQAAGYAQFEKVWAR